MSGKVYLDLGYLLFWPVLVEPILNASLLPLEPPCRILLCSILRAPIIDQLLATNEKVDCVAAIWILFQALLGSSFL